MLKSKWCLEIFMVKCQAQHIFDALLPTFVPFHLRKLTHPALGARNRPLAVQVEFPGPPEVSPGPQMEGMICLLGKIRKYIIWLVVDLPLWKIWKSIGMMTFPIYGNIKNVPNHQPVMVLLELRNTSVRAVIVASATRIPILHVFNDSTDISDSENPGFDALIQYKTNVQCPCSMYVEHVNSWYLKSIVWCLKTQLSLMVQSHSNPWNPIGPHPHPFQCRHLGKNGSSERSLMGWSCSIYCQTMWCNSVPYFETTNTWFCKCLVCLWGTGMTPISMECSNPSISFKSLCNCP